MRTFNEWSADVRRMLDGFSVATQEAGDDDAGAFRAVASILEKADKKMAVLRSIVEHAGLQSPNADPLVVSAILDATGSITRHEVRCRLGHTKGKLSYEVDDASSVALLVANGKEQQTALRTAAEQSVASLLSELGSSATKSVPLHGTVLR